jgi:hypothetical protein
VNSGRVSPGRIQNGANESQGQDLPSGEGILLIGGSKDTVKRKKKLKSAKYAPKVTLGP